MGSRDSGYINLSRTSSQARENGAATRRIEEVVRRKEG